MSHTLKIQHDLRDVLVKPTEKVEQARLKNMISPGMDQYTMSLCPLKRCTMKSDSATAMLIELRVTICGRIANGPG